MAQRAFLHLVKYGLAIDKANTQTTAKERDCIARYASRAASAIEIGVFEGVNTVLIGRAIADGGKVYGVDPFFKGKLGICYHKYIAKLNISRNQLSKKVTLIEKLSVDAAGELPEKVDFIFVDGDHSYEGIKKDWELYSKKLNVNGIIALHDTSVPDFDPGRVGLGSVGFFSDVISKDNRFQVLETVDSLNILRRIN